ncbi:MAG: hypothetical protein JKY32_16070 [Rhizobiales bacterium]|nr:hypothetical protein [Hyphomicrobiales bacterium]
MDSRDEHGNEEEDWWNGRGVISTPVIPDKRRPGWFTCLGVNPLRDPGSSLYDFVFGTTALDSGFRRNDDLAFN